MSRHSTKTKEYAEQICRLLLHGNCRVSVRRAIIDSRWHSPSKYELCTDLTYHNSRRSKFILISIFAFAQTRSRYPLLNRERPMHDGVRQLAQKNYAKNEVSFRLKSKQCRSRASQRATGELLCSTTFCLMQINFKRIRWNILRSKICERIVNDEICITWGSGSSCSRDRRQRAMHTDTAWIVQ